MEKCKFSTFEHFAIKYDLNYRRRKRKNKCSIDIRIGFEKTQKITFETLKYWNLKTWKVRVNYLE